MKNFILLWLLACLVLVLAYHQQAAIETAASAVPTSTPLAVTNDDATLGYALHAWPDAVAEKGIMALGVASNGDYAPLQMDVNGKLLFECKEGKCPDKFCKRMACKFFADEIQKAECECVNGK